MGEVIALLAPKGAGETLAAKTMNKEELALACTRQFECFAWHCDNLIMRLRAGQQYPGDQAYQTLADFVALVMKLRRKTAREHRADGGLLRLDLKATRLKLLIANASNSTPRARVRLPRSVNELARGFAEYCADAQVAFPNISISESRQASC